MPEGAVTSLADILRSQPPLPQYRQAVADAPTLLGHAENPSPRSLLDVLMLAAAVLGRQTQAGDPNVQQMALPNTPAAMAGAPLTRVMSGGKPTRVFHGTAGAFESLDPRYARGRSMYGPGFYHTENPSVASGYAAGRRSSAAPNVRPAYLDVVRPFDVDAPLPVEQARKIVLKTGHISTYDVLDDLARAAENGTAITGGQLYDLMASKMPKVLVNQTLRGMGYDGITHIGGARMGTTPHRVWIAFDPEQVVNPFLYDVQHGRGALNPAIEGILR